MTAKERLHAAIQGRSRDRVPVTPIFMQWAAAHIGHTYRDFYLDGSVLVRAGLAVAESLGIDQVSAISDPWREASGYGMVFDYPADSVGVPRAHILVSEEDVARLTPLDCLAAPRMSQRVRSVASFVDRVGETHSVLGWVEGPIAAYASLRGVEQTMIDLACDPELFEGAAEVLVETAARFATAQIMAGADVIGVGDAAASLIGPALYNGHVQPWEQKLCERIHECGAMVKLHICGNTRDIVAGMAATGADIVDLDWMVPVAEVREEVGPEVCLCGNFDPAGVLLAGPASAVAAAAKTCISEGGDRFILMPGCEVPPGTPEAHLRAFCPTDGCRIRDALALF